MCKLTIVWLLLTVSVAAGSPLELSEPQVVGQLAGATRLRIETGAGGDFHMAAYLPKTQQIAYVRYHEGKWLKPVIVAASKPRHYADVAGDSKGYAYLTWVNAARDTLYFATVAPDGKVKLETRPTQGMALRSEVVVDTSGYVRVVYREKSPEKVVFLSRKAGSDKWESVSSVPVQDEPGASQRRHGLMAGRDGKAYCAYRYNNSAGARVLRYRVFDAAKGKWTEPLAEFRGKLKPWGPSMFQDAKGKLHMAWYSGYGKKSRLVYRDPAGRLSILGRGYSEEGYQPVVAVIGETLVVIRSTIENYYSDEVSGTVEYFVNMGDKFAPPVDVGKPGAKSYGTMAADEDSLIIAWAQDGRVYYRIAKVSAKPTQPTTRRAEKREDSITDGNKND